jgi:hypothetical protein
MFLFTATHATHPAELVPLEVIAATDGEARVIAHRAGYTIHGPGDPNRVPVQRLESPEPISAAHAQQLLARLDTLQGELNRTNAYVTSLNTVAYWKIFQNRVMWGVGLGTILAVLLWILIALIVILVIGLIGGVANLNR